MYHEVERLRKALRDLVDRCDGPEGVRADGSNIPTMDAHAALGDFDEVTSEDKAIYKDWRDALDKFYENESAPLLCNVTPEEGSIGPHELKS